MAGRRILRTCSLGMVILALASFAVELPPISAEEALPAELPTTPCPPIQRNESDCEELELRLPNGRPESIVERGCNYAGNHYNVGDRWVTGPPDKCAQLLCEANGGMSATPCAWPSLPPGCTIKPGDQEAVFPACCPYVDCT